MRIIFRKRLTIFDVSCSLTVPSVPDRCKLSPGRMAFLHGKGRRKIQQAVSPPGNVRDPKVAERIWLTSDADFDRVWANGLIRRPCMGKQGCHRS